MKKITSFSGSYRWLSNFYPCVVQYEGRFYASVEHAYQASKTLDTNRRKVICLAGSAGEAKLLGNDKNATVLRNDWEQVCVEIMRKLLKQKFDDAILRDWLLATGDAHLEEGNTWGDTFWGTCRGRGENKLGILLMSIRDCIRESSM